MNVIVCPKSATCNKRIISIYEKIAAIFAYHKIVAIKNIIINSVYCASCTIVIISSN